MKKIYILFLLFSCSHIINASESSVIRIMKTRMDVPSRHHRSFEVVNKTSLALVASEKKAQQIEAEIKQKIKENPILAQFLQSQRALLLEQLQDIERLIAAHKESLKLNNPAPEALDRTLANLKDNRNTIILHLTVEKYKLSALPHKTLVHLYPALHNYKAWVKFNTITSSNFEDTKILINPDNYSYVQSKIPEWTVYGVRNCTLPPREDWGIPVVISKKYVKEADKFRYQLWPTELDRIYGEPYPDICSL